MAGMIKREDIAAVRERSRIDEIASQYVTLRPGGVDSMKGLCPFHDEKTPSFHVRPQLGLWHCFGCDEGGDVISFVMKVNSMTFVEAVEYLADRGGIQLRYEDEGSGSRFTRGGVEPGRRQRMVEANRIADTFFREQLASPEAMIGRRFLGERGFDEGAIEHFGIGYAPKGWDAITKHLRGRGFTEPEIVASGLVSQGQRGVYDRFRGRLIWPIRDLSGATVGFGARRLHDDDQGPKYLNTPETTLYKKSQVLYGVDLARKPIATKRQVVVVEGYTDVMAMHLAGVDTAVASCGTAFGLDHIRVVRRLLGDIADGATGLAFSAQVTRGGEVIFTFDGDAAGQKAALKAFDEDQRFAAQTFVAVEPNGMDPCDLRLAKGDQALAELVETREPLFEFAIRVALKQVDLATAEGRVAGLRAAAPVVAGIRDRALRSEYSRTLSGWLGMDEESVRRAVAGAERRGTDQRGSEQRGALGRFSPSGAPGRFSPSGAPGRFSPSEAGADGWLGGWRGGRDSGGNGPPSGQRRRLDPMELVERQALEVALQLPGIAEDSGFDELPPSTFLVPAHRAVHEAIVAAGGCGAVGKDQVGWLEDVRAGAADEITNFISALAVAPLPADTRTQLEGYASGIMVSLIRTVLTRRIADVRGRLQRAPEGSEEARTQFELLVRLENQRRALMASQD
ncbi:MAG TPA: DNA primase [Actinomycetaceae bacterium]|nr:DNA primase [Actinomycetaceae bacterium]